MAYAKKIRVLLVDDEPLARDMLRELLAGDSMVESVCECANGREAVRALNVCAPDVLFLDVQMPETGGFELLEALSHRRPPRIIFMTAFDQCAVRAFELRSLDYLLKPFDRERFDASWQRARTQALHALNGNQDQQLGELLQELKARSNFTGPE